MAELKYFKATELEFERIFEIMDFSFPDNEMRTREKQYQLMTTNDRYSIICFGNDSDVLGFIVVWELENFIFIENFATTQSMRGQGFGGNLLDFIIESYKDKKDIILEVEPPVDEMTRRRIGFYERHGFILNHFDYLMPPLRQGDDFLPLKIMCYQKSFTKQSFEEYKEQIYKIVYETK